MSLKPSKLENLTIISDNVDLVAKYESRVNLEKSQRKGEAMKKVKLSRARRDDGEEGSIIFEPPNEENELEEDEDVADIEDLLHSDDDD